MVCTSCLYILARSPADNFPAIGTAETTTSAARVLAQLGGGKIASTLPPSGDYPESVEVKQGTFTTPSH